MDENSKTRSGVSVGFLAAVAWFSALTTAWVPILIAGALLFLEKNAWLKKQLIKVIVVVLAFAAVNTVLFSHFLNQVFTSRLDVGGLSLQLNGIAGLQWFEMIIFLAEDVVYIVMAIRAWKMTQSYSSLDHFAGSCLADGASAAAAPGYNPVASVQPANVAVQPTPVAPAPVPAAPVCPKCGKPVSSDMDFCVNCGTKLR